MTRQPWIGGPGIDLPFIVGPAIVVSLVVLALPGVFTTREVSPLLWAVLIVGVDVTHVYSTLFRTYFDPAEMRRAPALYVLAPVLGWMAFAGLYSLGAMVFWRCLAYLAVFHFVRQQYGFMMLYGRWEGRRRLIDAAAIYAATLYPLAWWHLHARQFNWFVDGDFLSFQAPPLGGALLAAYLAIMAAYVVKEIRLLRRAGRVNWPRNLLLAGTALSWWVGIIAMDSDLAFTAVNVVAHGIPYMALVWVYGRAKTGDLVLGVLPSSKAFSPAFLPLFLALPLLLAYLEEGLWDGFVWAEHPSLFPAFTALPVIRTDDLLVLLVPLLALPQITHYILDGFIWRRGRAPDTWRATLRAGAE
jgi:hypothetical protein